MAGKGDTLRPIKDKRQFDKNWDRIFSNKNEKKPETENKE